LWTPTECGIGAADVDADDRSCTVSRHRAGAPPRTFPQAMPAHQKPQRGLTIAQAAEGASVSGAPHGRSSRKAAPASQGFHISPETCDAARRRDRPHRTMLLATRWCRWFSPTGGPCAHDFMGLRLRGPRRWTATTGKLAQCAHVRTRVDALGQSRAGGARTQCPYLAVNVRPFVFAMTSSVRLTSVLQN
jgi:hypothetical protein